MFIFPSSKRFSAYKQTHRDHQLPTERETTHQQHAV